MNVHSLSASTSLVTTVAIGIATITLAGCLIDGPKPPTPMTAGAYVGTGDGIYLEPSPDGELVIVEGDHRLTDEQALQAAGDQAYAEYRAQVATHNQHVYQTAQHRYIAGAICSWLAAGEFRNCAMVHRGWLRLRRETDERDIAYRRRSVPGGIRAVLGGW